MRQQFGRDAHARIAHFDHHHRHRRRLSSVRRLNAEPDAAAFVGVLGGVGEQVDQHLLQPRSVSKQKDRLQRQRHLELVPALIDQRLGRLDRPLHDAAQGDLLLAQLNPASGDAGDFQQIIDQMRQLPQLTLDDMARLLLQGRFALLQTQQLHRVGQGGQRVAQLMAEHRQKFVLAPVQVCQGLRLLQ